MRAIVLCFLLMAGGACGGTVAVETNEPLLAGEWVGRRADLRLDYRYTVIVRGELPSISGETILRVLYTGTENEILGSPMTTQLSGSLDFPDLTLDLTGGTYRAVVSEDLRTISGTIQFPGRPRSDLVLTRR